MQNVLIVQPTIPHYRVPFFNALERLRPKAWRFDVTCDSAEVSSPRFLQNPLDADTFKFPTIDVSHISMPLFGRNLNYQTVWKRAAGYDLVIVQHALFDLAYPACLLHRLHGVRFAWWGHGRDRAVEAPRGGKALAECVKMALTRISDGYFAYTDGVRQELIEYGLPDGRVFSLRNTIDIDEQHRAYEAVRPQRDEIRERLGVADKRVLLFVGRFTENKRLPFLLDAFARLYERRPDTHLFLVGGPGEALDIDARPGVQWLGGIEDLSILAPIYTASDVLVYPGAVGLGPLQALCYDLPVVTIDSSVHMPEVEYITPENSLMLPRSTQADDYADALDLLLSDEDRLGALRAGTWPSIQHLTIDAMASNFIAGVNTILDI